MSDVGCPAAEGATGFALDGNAVACRAVTANTASAGSTSQKWASVFTVS